MKQTKRTRLYQDFIEKIKTRVFKAGEMLPSTRDLAKLHRCHRFTIMDVCQDLAAEGWLISTGKKRYVISDKIPITFSQQSDRALKRKKMTVTVTNPGGDIGAEKAKHRLEFWGGQPDLKLFPKDEFRRTLSAALKRSPPGQLEYGLIAGLPSALAEFKEYMRKTRQITDRDLIVTNGSQEALYIAAKVFVKPGDKIAVERKGYPPAWKIFESLGAELIPIEVDEEGIDTASLEKIASKHKIKLIYVTPLHHYPTTVSLSPRRRQALIQLSEKNGIPILEDDYDYEFHYTLVPPPPLVTETPNAIYICSFSKVLFPGIRIGLICCDQELSDHLSYQKYLISRQTDSLSQIAVSAWMRDGGFEKHLRRMRSIYESRYNFMLQELEKIKKNKNISWREPNGGMSIWVNLNQNSRQVAENAAAKGIMFQYEQQMDYLQKAGSHLRIGFAGVNEGQIKEGLGALAQLIK